jgi:hypothetical protein
MMTLGTHVTCRECYPKSPLEKVPETMFGRTWPCCDCGKETDEYAFIYTDQNRLKCGGKGSMHALLKRSVA